MIYLEVIFHSLKVVHISDIRMKENNACVIKGIYMVYSRNIFNCCSQSCFKQIWISPLNPVTSQEESQNALSVGN